MHLHLHEQWVSACPRAPFARADTLTLYLCEHKWSYICPLFTLNHPLFLLHHHPPGHKAEKVGELCSIITTLPKKKKTVWVGWELHQSQQKFAHSGCTEK